MTTVHVYLTPGTMTQVPDAWCNACQLPSIWTGPVWRLSPEGVAPHGQVTGCADCATWVTRPARPAEVAVLAEGARHPS